MNFRYLSQPSGFPALATPRIGDCPPPPPPIEQEAFTDGKQLFPKPQN